MHLGRFEAVEPAANASPSFVRPASIRRLYWGAPRSCSAIQRVYRTKLLLGNRVNCCFAPSEVAPIRSKVSLLPVLSSAPENATGLPLGSEPPSVYFFE